MKKKTFEIQIGGEIPKPNPIRDRYKIKLENLLKIMSKLATINAYDSNGQIRNKNGDFMERTNISQLLSYAMSINKIVHGEEEFINLLNEAGVPPDWITNENIKRKLRPQIEPRFVPDKTEPIVIVKENNETNPEEIEETPIVTFKRKHDDEDDDSQYKRPKLTGEGIKWIIPKRKTR